MGLGELEVKERGKWVSALRDLPGDRGLSDTCPSMLNSLGGVRIGD